MTCEFSDILKITTGLSSVQRYSQTKMATPESVLEHSGDVALLAYFIGKRLQKEGHLIDMGMLLSKAIVHDIDETITGDIARPVKYSSSEIRELLHRMEHDAVDEMDDELLMEGELLNDWTCAKIGTEGKIIALCDVLSVAGKCSDEILVNGNLSMKKYVAGLGGLINEKSKDLQHELDESSETIYEIENDAELIIEKILKKLARNGVKFL